MPEITYATLVAELEKADLEVGQLTEALVQAEGEAADLHMVRLVLEMDLAGARAQIDQLQASLLEKVTVLATVEDQLACATWHLTEAGLAVTGGTR